MIYNKSIDHEIKTDILVVGGGLAGFAAAVAAARQGAKTLLIDRNAMLGGMATAGLVGPFMTCYDNDAQEQIVKGIFDELCLRMEKSGGAIHPSKIEGMTTYSSYYWDSHRHVTPFSSENLAVTMEQMANEAGVQILYNVQLIDCVLSNRKIDKVIVALKEGLAYITAAQVIDCTGDADVAFYAGLSVVKGDEDSGQMQPCTLFFEVGNMDREKFVGELEARKAAGQLGIPAKNCWSWLVEDARRSGEWTIPRNEIGNYEQNEPGRWKINCTRMTHVDGTKTSEVSAALIEGRQQVSQIMEFMRKHLPGCENLQLLQVATALGVRESRRIEGLYKLTVDDIMSRKHFDDAICTFGYAVDIHNSGDGGVTFQCVNGYYTIPYRSLIPRGCDNLLAAGRCISGSSGAAASYRVMPACAATGEAAGTAAALAWEQGVTPQQVDPEQLKSILISNGAVIKE